MSSLYFSHEERRRDAVAARADLNGIDFLEVHDSPALPLAERQRTLFVHFINDPGALALGPNHVVIEGGERVRDVRVTGAAIAIDPRSGDTTRPVLVVDVDKRGDFSTYTLQLVEDPAAPGALANIDPVLRAIDFSFKVNCPSDFDCAPRHSCPPAALPEPAIDYLARDFNSIRQLLLDRLAVVAPQWKDRNIADIGITLVELLAYVGDQMSYRQDAVATEAYLGTARRRISVRRHARLADYHMHDGCNARAWLQVQVDPTVSDPVTLTRGTQVLTAIENNPFPIIQPGSSQYAEAIGSGAEVFEVMHDATVHAAHNEMRFYTWGARQSCLPRGAVRATLDGALPQLRPGDFLLLREVLSPRSGQADDALFEHRHIVKLVEVTPRIDPLGGQFQEPPVNAPRPVTDIRWAVEDALPFPLCISAELDEDFGGGFVENVSLASGNLVLVDHGRTLPAEELDTVPSPNVARLPAAMGENDSAEPGQCECESTQRRLQFAPLRYRPSLRESPLTQATPLPSPAQLTSASAAFDWDIEQALPAIALESVRPDSVGLSEPWRVRRDLLSTPPDGREFVVELDNDSRAYLRFGDGAHGAAVTPGMNFRAVYRIGNGQRGNVGAGTLVHLVTTDTRIQSVSNPLPARGAREPETIEEVRQRAPFAFREEQKRAVTAADYAQQAARYAGVQRAAGTLRWTGSWHTMFVSVDRRGGAVIDPDFERNLRAHLEPLRMAGLDLEIDPPRPVALELALRVRVRPDYFASDVELALLDLFTSGTRRDGQPGFFHPDRFTFGQTVYLSPWVAAAQAVPGVASVEVERFERRDAPGDAGKNAGFIKLGRLEVPVLENNRNFPERGFFDAIMEGGK
jgi:hypothetical protein